MCARKVGERLAMEGAVPKKAQEPHGRGITFRTPFNPQQNMSYTHRLSATFLQPDDMVSVLRLDHIGNLSRLQGKDCFFEFPHILPTLCPGHFTSAGGSAVDRIPSREIRKISPRTNAV